MGNLFKVFEKKKKDLRVLMIGLDNAGKTTILKQMGLQKMYSKKQQEKDVGEEIDPEDTQPTVGFNVKEVEYKNVKFVVWDLGGQETIRSLWVHYYKGTSGIVYVVDSSDTKRIQESVDQLNTVLNDQQLTSCPLLIFGNKNDKKGALNEKEMSEKYKTEELLKNREVFVKSCCAIAKNGGGLEEGLNWFVSHFK